MAERRMFAKTIIGSGKFLRMPPSTRLLYYDLGMYADDDGVVEAFTVMRQTGATEDDLRVLVSKGFVQVLNDELVTLINDWKVNNYIQNDRYHPSVYKELLIQFKTSMDTKCIQDGYKLDTEVRLGKDRSGKNRLDKENVVNITPYDSEEFRKEKQDPLVMYSQQCLVGMSYDNVDEMVSYRDCFSDEMIREAINLTNANGSRNWSYTRAILRKWQKNGFWTIGDVRAAEEKRQSNKSNKQGGVTSGVNFQSACGSIGNEV